MKELLWYLASPYTNYDEDEEVRRKIHDARFRQVSADAADLMRLGFVIFSPIAHTHPIAEYGHIEHGDHTIWLPADKVIHARCDGIIIDMIPGWQDSYGVDKELKWAMDEDKPIMYYRPKVILPELQPHG